MSNAEHDLILNALLEIKEDTGALKAEMISIREHLRILNGKVAEHSSFILTAKAKLAIIATIAGSVGSLVLLYVKNKLDL